MRNWEGIYDLPLAKGCNGANQAGFYTWHRRKRCLLSKGEVGKLWTHEGKYQMHLWRCWHGREAIEWVSRKESVVEGWKAQHRTQDTRHKTHGTWHWTLDTLDTGHLDTGHWTHWTFGHWTLDIWTHGHWTLDMDHDGHWVGGALGPPPQCPPRRTLTRRCALFVRPLGSILVLISIFIYLYNKHYCLNWWFFFWPHRSDLAYNRPSCPSLFLFFLCPTK